MARTAVRTVRLNLDVSNKIITLFGSIKNTHRQLGLNGRLPYQTLYEAFHGMPLRPEHKDVIEDAWAKWQLYYLRPEVPPSDLLQLTPETITIYPPWLKRQKNGKR